MKIVMLLSFLVITGCSTTQDTQQKVAVTELPLPSSLKTFVYSESGKGYWVDIALKD